VFGVGTALPGTRVEQGVAAEVVIDLAGLDGSTAQWTRRLFARSGVAERRTVLGELSAGRPPFGPVKRPGTAARMALYREHAGPLAATAGRRALAAASVDPRAVTGLIVVSCTGYHAPGVDVELVQRLGLRADVDRTVIGFMGCYGAFAGLRAARRYVLADPAALVLVVCVELCTLHLRADASSDSLVAFSLFGDGAAAAVVGAERPLGDVVMALGPPAMRVEAGTGPMMGWTIGDDGFEMTLAAEVPTRIGGAVAAFADPLSGGRETDSWCIHPGGPAILAAAERALDLGPSALDVSRSVLRDIGNVSSATILFVLQRAAARIPEGARGVALGFGPGLTLEGFPFRRGGAPCRVAEPVPLATEASV
jgi:predicted naringenin-chalcone synthase